MRKTYLSERGFTLIELLISVALLSIILGALYSSFFLSHKAVSAVDDSIIKLQEMRMFMDTISREVESLSYSHDNKWTLFKAEDRDIYGRQTSRLSFSTLSPQRPGLSLNTYYVEDRKGVLTLLKKSAWAYEKEDRAKDDTGAAELIDGIESFTIEVGKDNKWLKTWDTAETKSPPSEVRIALSVRIKDRSLSMYEVIRPKKGQQI